MPIITPDQAGGANVCAFLDLIAFSEGTSKASGSASAAISQYDGYDVIVAGPEGPEVFADFSDHPFAHRAPKIVEPPSAEHPKGVNSTASGRYQVLCHYFEVYKVQLGLPDFSPLSQDLVAIQQIKERKDTNGTTALQHIEAGRIATAIGLCSAIWASMPGNKYGQGGHTTAALLEEWNDLTAA